MARRSTKKPEDRNGTIPVPAGAPSWVTPALLEHTLRVWQPYYAAPLTPEDALAIIQSVGCLIEVLAGEARP
jgi:hypothetical protein